MSYKTVAQRPPLVRLAVVLLAAAVLVGSGVAFGRWVLAGEERAPGPAPVVGIRYVDGVPVGFAATARGAGDAAAWYETLIADAGSRPRAEVRQLVGRLVAPASRPVLVDRLMPSTGREGNGNIVQTLVARVWADGAGDPAELTAGARVRVQTYAVGLFGARTDGVSAGRAAGLAGGWFVHDMVLELVDTGWALSQVDSPVPAPPPDVRGTARDGTPRDTDVLARVLGPDSWVPEMP